MYFFKNKMTFIAATIIALTGCAKMHKNHDANLNDDAAAQTYAMQNQNVMAGSNGELVNELVAPRSQTYYFDFDQNSVNSNYYKSIAIQASYLTTHATARIRLEGNTDNRGSREYNIGLGWRRDQAVATLFKQQGVRAEQIDMVSYGKEKPAVLGDNESAWHLNRRVSLVYESY